MSDEQIDTDYTDEMVCPYCGAEIGDSWEIEPDKEDGAYECDSCGKTFGWSRIIVVNYTTRKVTNE